MPTYTLPDLPYDFGALEPHISGKIMELHHDKHHAAYVKGANETLDKLGEARASEDFSRLGSLEKKLAFNLSGHVLHSLFWKNLAPKSGDRPTGELAQAIQNDFGGFEKFRKQMTDTFSGTPFAPLEEHVRRNMELFQQTFSMFKPFTPGAVRTDEKSAEPAVAADDNIDDLRRQMKDMQDRLDRMSEPKKDEQG